MDDRDLEARLRDRLHRRFDSGQPSAELTTAVAQALATVPRTVGWRSVRSPQLRIAWSLGAAVLLAAVALVTLNTGGRFVPPGVGSSPSPSPSARVPAERTFVVMSRSTDNPSKGATGLASDVLGARLQMFDFGAFSSGAGYGITFSLPAVGPSDATIRTVLGANGDVAIVPLPAADYRDRGVAAEAGKALPKAEPALFGWEGIASVSRDTRGPTPAIAMQLKPLAAQAFADYTTGEVGGQFAVVVDGIVAAVPTITEPIIDGQVIVTAPSEPVDAFARTIAILVGGPLPERWRNPDVPVIIPEDSAAAAALRQYPADGVGAIDIDVVEDGGHWRALWRVTLFGSFLGECPNTIPARSSCPSADSIQVTLDAVTGAFIESVAPAP
jgi:hypothetical protein